MRRAFNSARGRMALLFVAALLGILVAAPGAFAQSAVDQYVPVFEPPTEGGQKPALVTGGRADGPAGGEAGADGGGKLPFTGYPLTPIAAIVAALLAAGLVVRFALPAIGRRQDSVSTR